MVRFKQFLKKAVHIHKYKTLLMYPPRKQYQQEQRWGFLLRCDCGYTKLTKLPYGITEVFEVRPTNGQSINTDDNP